MSTDWRALASVVREPSDEDLLELAEDWPATTGPRHDLSGCPEVPLYSVFADEVVEFARAVLARYGHQPAPPAEGEVAELVALIRQIALTWEPDACLLGNMTAGQLARAADLLERQAAPVPVAVSERLPGPEDLDDQRRCWWLAPETDTKCGCWCLGPGTCLPPEGFGETHWLPAHALPLPSGEVQP